MTILESPQRPASSVSIPVILGAVALAVTVARTVTMVQQFAAAAVATPWGHLLPTEAAIWLGWLLWGAALVPLMAGVVDHPAARGSTAWKLILLILLPVGLVPLVAAPVHWAGFGGTLPQTWLHMLLHNGLTDLLLGMAFVGVAYSSLSLRRARLLEVTAARLNAQLADAQLETLRAQLDPHFLFNALNSIAVLARRGLTGDVEQMVTRLAGLLRHSLESSRAQLVTLGAELAAVRYYLEIEQVRYADRLVVRLDVPEALHAAIVPSFLLQPLVENAIRHGFTDATHPLHLEVGVEALTDGVRITIANDGAGLIEGGRRDGVGLGHTKARLAALYGACASLSLRPGPSGAGAIVVIELPRRPPASATEPQ
ncbi:MAG: histidine kinase [Gemmatimonadota bacterium]